MGAWEGGRRDGKGDACVSRPLWRGRAQSQGTTRCTVAVHMRLHGPLVQQRCTLASTPGFWDGALARLQKKANRAIQNFKHNTHTPHAPFWRLFSHPPSSNVAREKGQTNFENSTLNGPAKRYNPTTQHDHAMSAH